MPPLRNHKHERFVLGLAEGLSAVDAHERAGYARDDGNAARLRANPKVVERLAELQAEVAKDTKVTVESIIAELTDLTAKATSKSQFTAAIRAVVEKSRIAGLLIERVEIGGPGDFEECNSTAEVVDEYLKYGINGYHDFRDADRQALIAMFERHNAEARAFIEAIKSRPFIAVSPPKQIGSGNGQNRRLNGQASAKSDSIEQ
jgi:phage terminase small subunit